ncbi:hypothetical protein BN2475_1390009 [Paraburkholderia ribeironis]|uniref:Uncharacterized protein n=1 Tax=Paraburkholderia ribeironis TaxID=1247936 RepID=A0A1N7SPZ8_9BURK|nr:hypothetical protein BN2475_1390009 [Paraburkholderia ribeironis]
MRHSHSATHARLRLKPNLSRRLVEPVVGIRAAKARLVLDRVTQRDDTDVVVMHATDHQR